jgi:integrase
LKSVPRRANGTDDPRRPPKRRRNVEVRSREYLTAAEVEKLITVAGKNRNGQRDAAMVLIAYRHGLRATELVSLRWDAIAYRHGLRATELVSLRWDAVDFRHGQLHVRRAKNGAPSVHPLTGRELRALRQVQREQEPKSSFVFTSERAAPFTTAGFRKMIARLGVAAGFEVPIHPHMLRHACGFQLANLGTDTRTLQAYLGHKNIQHTVRYTELSPTRFKNLWQD